MSKVRLEILSAFAEVLGMPSKIDEAIPEREVDGDNSIKGLLDRLSARYEHFGQMIFDNTSQGLSGEMIVFLNGHSIELTDGLQTILRDGDIITLVPFIQGG